MITSNRSELRAVTGARKDEADLARRAAGVRQALDIDALLVTLQRGRHELRFVPVAPSMYRPWVQQVFDVSGAGDT